MQFDGNLVVYDEVSGVRKEMWVSDTSHNLGSKLIVTDDGNASIMNTAPSIIWSALSSNPLVPTSAPVSVQSKCNFNSALCDNFQLAPGNRNYGGNFICSSNREYQLGIGPGDFCLCESSVEIWCAGINSGLSNGAYLVMQHDGNLVIYDQTPAGTTVAWRSSTAGNHNSNLIVTDDGSASIINPSQDIIWSTSPALITTSSPTLPPSFKPNSTPTLPPTFKPTATSAPTLLPTFKPTSAPTTTSAPTLLPTSTPSSIPTTTSTPTPPQTSAPSSTPTITSTPTSPLTSAPTSLPTVSPIPSFQTEHFVVYIMGDTPYTRIDSVKLRQQINSLPRDAGALFHLGDIMRGFQGLCSLERYTGVYEDLKKSHAPLFIVPGDNDANDCPSFDRAWHNWKTAFLHPSRVAESVWDVSHFGEITRQQSSANFAFVHRRVLIIGVDVVGGQPHNRREWKSRHADNVDWIETHIQRYYGVEADTILLLGHARPAKSTSEFFQSSFNTLQNLNVNMNRVLYVHGDGHQVESYSAYGFKCVQVDKGSGKWMKLTLRTSHPDPFDYVHIDII